MPELLTRRETPQSIVGRVAGFKSELVAGFISEWWRTSNRNDGRLRLGIPGRLRLEIPGRLRLGIPGRLRLGISGRLRLGIPGRLQSDPHSNLHGVNITNARQTANKCSIIAGLGDEADAVSRFPAAIGRGTK